MPTNDDARRRFERFRAAVAASSLGTPEALADQGAGMLARMTFEDGADAQVQLLAIPLELWPPLRDWAAATFGPDRTEAIHVTYRAHELLQLAISAAAWPAVRAWLLDNGVELTRPGPVTYARIVTPRQLAGTRPLLERVKDILLGRR